MAASSQGALSCAPDWQNKQFWEERDGNIPVMVMPLASCDSLRKVVLPSSPATMDSGRVESWLGSSKEEKTREKHSVWREMEENERSFGMMTVWLTSRATSRWVRHRYPSPVGWTL